MTARRKSQGNRTQSEARAQSRKPTPTTLFGRCVYTIIGRDKLEEGIRVGQMVAREGKPWVGAKLWLEESRANGKRLPLVLADSQRCRDIIGWGVLEKISIEGKETEYVVSDLHTIKGRTQQELVIRATQNFIAVGHQRTYVLCDTPTFVIAADRALEKARNTIKKAPHPALDANEEHEDLIGLEGEVRLRMVQHRRRELRLRRHKIEESKRANGGHLICEVPGCGFDFHQRYGELGRDFAHVHHLKPLGDRDGNDTTQLAELAVVCANCHAMIHVGGESRPLFALIRSSR